ncbi:hypothetical protein A2U01_0111842, partial [Trifolium medium]|nr:hypothetical protein [Trifolium medium]
MRDAQMTEALSFPFPLLARRAILPVRRAIARRIPCLLLCSGATRHYPCAARRNRTPAS